MFDEKFPKYRGKNSTHKHQQYQKPPPYNPDYKKNQSNSSCSTRNSSHGSRGPSINLLILKHQIITLLLLSSFLAIWFLTPFSDVITSLVLVTMPITGDVQLGLESWHEIRQKHPHKYQITQDHWNVESIGNDIVNSVILQPRNLHHFCTSTPTISTDLCKQQASQYNWSFHVVKSSDINAFALPGGIICVTDSLLRTLNLSRGEIAALLGHEMSHVLHRHGQSQLLKKNLLSTIIKALFYDDDDDEEESFGEAVHELLLKQASYFGQLKFSRNNEYEADSGAWELLSSSQRYNPHRVQDLLQKLYSLEGGKRKNTEYDFISSSSLSAWAKTHPGTGDRIGVMKDKWNDLSLNERRKFQPLL